MNPSKVIATVVTGWATAWTLHTFGAPNGVVLILGLLAGGVTAVLVRRHTTTAVIRRR